MLIDESWLCASCCGDDRMVGTRRSAPMWLNITRVLHMSREGREYQNRAPSKPDERYKSLPITGTPSLLFKHPRNCGPSSTKRKTSERQVATSLPEVFVWFPLPVPAICEQTLEKRTQKHLA